MKLNRSTGWLLFILTPLLMSVRTQHTDPGKADTRLGIIPTRPASITRQQRLLEDQVQVLWRQVEEWWQGSRPVGRHSGGCLCGTGNIALPMADVVKE